MSTDARASSLPSIRLGCVGLPFAGAPGHADPNSPPRALWTLRGDRDRVQRESRRIDRNARRARPRRPSPEPAPTTPARADPADVHIEGDHLTIDRKIHFAHDSDEILDDSTEILDHIAEALKNHNRVGQGSRRRPHRFERRRCHNKDLSERRAAAVVTALRERGVEQEIDSKGAGETELACTEDTDECHEQNRRVEFIVEPK